MVLDWAIIAVHAEQQANGAFAILGAGIENIGSIVREDLPPVVQERMDPGVVGFDVSFQIVAKFRLPRHELQRAHTIESEVIDADGESVTKMTCNLPPMQAPAGQAAGADTGIATQLQVRIAPRRFGLYTVALFADTAAVKQIPFAIVPVRGPQAAVT